MLKDISLKDVVVSIISAVDIMNPILKNHHRHTAIIAYKIGQACGLPEKALAELVVAASMHDIGALTVDEASKLVYMDVEDPEAHEVMGSVMLSGYKGFEEISHIILHHHIKYCDCDQYQLVDESVKIESFMLHLSDRIDILVDYNQPILNQMDAIILAIDEFSGTLFDPSIVSVFMDLARTETFWLDITEWSMAFLLNQVNIGLILGRDDIIELEQLVSTLCRIIDFKSVFTAAHSAGVAGVAYELALLDGFDESHCQEIRIAAYLHDIGKIAVPSEIIGKPAALSFDEKQLIKSHAYYTKKILNHIKGFEDIAYWASSHHEKNDGSGYPNHLTELTREIEIISYADIFTALCESRPYRQALDKDEALEIIKLKYKNQLGDHVYDLIEANKGHLDEIRVNLQKEAFKVYESINYYRL